MHYIRFLKSPKIVGDGDERALVAKITIATDLGESFLAADVGVEVEVVGSDGESILGPGKEYLWKGREGMRSLEVSLPMKRVRKVDVVRMCVCAFGEAYTDTFESVLGLDYPSRKVQNRGGVITARSLEVDFRSGQSIGAGMVERVFRNSRAQIHIWEETGESIARHVWDAGLVLSSYIASLPLPTDSTLPHLPKLETTLSQPNLNILELGAGCGIVGITLLHTLPTRSQIHLTDLPEATEILTRNLIPSILDPLPPNLSKITHQVLDWSSPLPPNVAATSWDVVFVADCTYNPDVVPDLVETLGSVAEGSGGVRIVVAMKVRHESEMVFFELMEQRDFVVREKAVLALPVLGGEEEQIEVFVFGYGKAS